MIFLFTWANGLYLVKVNQSEWNWLRFAFVFLLQLSFFFRMRLFDEIKDYEVDLKVNPTRPLARGLIKIIDVKKALMILIAFELILAMGLGPSAFLIHAVAIGYSLLMYEEFFIGDYLRPHLTTYAVTHTFVSSLLGLSAGVAMSGMDLSKLDLRILAFFLMNWAFFNLFEFARKTFAPEEERSHVPSYSNIFGCDKAWGLSFSQAVLGIALIAQYFDKSIFIVVATLYWVFTLPYLLKRTKPSASLFRNVSGLYLLIHYLVLIYVVGV